MTWHELGKFLSEPLVLVALCAIGGGLMLGVVAWAFTGEYEKGGYESVHRRPADKDAKPWQIDTDGHPIVHAPKHKFAGEPDEGTRRLWPTTNVARSRVVMIGPEGIIDGNHAGEAGRVRQSPPEGHVEEEGGADRERGEDEGGTIPDGEEGSAHEEVPTLSVNAKWFRNTVTGEYVFIDENGARVEWTS